jgi:hypothetical protein
MSDVYERLRARLDEMAVGLPETENKIEIKLLKRLFSEAEADFFVQLHPMLESPDNVAERLNREPGEVADLMEQMAEKGLLFRKRDDHRVRYAAVPYVVGIFEFQVKSMDEDFARDNEAYFEQAFLANAQSFKTPVLRTVPINRQITVSAGPRPNLPAMIATSPMTTVFCLAPTLNIMLRTAWDAWSPRMRPNRSLSTMKKTDW